MIYIIGGRGFIGSAITRFCKEKSIPHEVIHRENYADFIGGACEILINANGNSKKYLVIEKPIEEFDASVRSVRETLEDFTAKTYVHLSSCDVYPDCSSPETTSENQEIDITQQSKYGFHKYLAEQCVQNNAKNWLILRMGGFVGPGIKKNPIFDILNDKPLWLDPESELQYMHTDHLAKILFTLLEMKQINQIFNVCGNGLLRLQSLIDHLGKSIEVMPDSELVTYNICIDKVSELVEIPNTEKTVFDFIDSQ